MPRYDYRCEAGHKYERQEPFGSPSEHACQRCGKPARRLLSTPTVVFKGSGWYKTDSRVSKDPDARSSTSSSSSSSSNGGSSNGSSSSKSDKKSSKSSSSD